MAAEQPKKPATAFFLYLEEQRAAIVKQLGDQAKARGIVSKTAAEQWRGLSAEAKAPYNTKAAATKAEYDKAVESFKATGGEMQRKKRKASFDMKPKKDKNAPKKPLNPYGQFLSENREKIVKSLPAGSHPLKDVAKAAGAQWKALSESEKKPYAEKFQAQMEEFRVAKAAYKAANPAPVEAETEQVTAKRGRPPTKRARKEGPKKPLNPYGQFLSENREKILKSLPAGSHPLKDVGKAAGAQWKALSESDKKPYEEKYRTQTEEFRVAQAAYKAANLAPAEAETEQVSPTKRTRKSVLKATPEKTGIPKRKAGSATKQSRGSGKSKAPEIVEVDATVLVEAQKLGFEAALRNLARREDVKALGKSDKDLLMAIKKTDGLVNPARHALLGGA